MEAKGQLITALDLLDKQTGTLERDQIEIAVRLNLTICMWNEPNGSGFTNSITLLNPAILLCEKIGDNASLFEVLWALQFQHSARAEPQQARAINEKLLRSATETRDTEMNARARTWRGYCSVYEGDFIAAQRDFDQVYNSTTAIPTARPLAYDWRIESRAFGSFALWALGHPEQAQREVPNHARVLVKKRR
jgi:hypothetical protein